MTNDLLNKGLIGFSNLGNTCFMNSVLQCIRYTIPLSIYFITNKITNENKLTDAYIKLCKDSWLTTNTYAPKEFKQALGQSNRMFRGFSQHDAQEMLIHLLDTLHDNLKSDNKSIISNLFHGRYKQTIHCPNCGYDSITYQPFVDIQVPLVESKNNIELIDCFNSLIDDEELDNYNMYNCEKCKNKVNAIKKMEIDILPDFLIVTLKRFNRMRKLDNAVNFPLNQFKILDKKYDLYATVNHFGSKNGGHYTANIKHPNGNWYNMNDSKCSKINNDNIINNSVYIAFFQKK